MSLIGGDNVSDWLAHPLDTRVHCIGIGGVGMAGMAALLKSRGFTVDGCDLADNALTKRLRRFGIPVSIGHDVRHLDPRPDLIVRSTAVADAHLEVVAARQFNIPVWRRGEVFPALLRQTRTVAISGTHGKTTTTALCAHVVRCRDLDPGFFIGGEWELPGRVYEQGDGSVMVVEADESDGTLANYHPDVAVITGIDFDHMEHFRDAEEFESVFQTFVRQTANTVIYCADDERVRRMVEEAGCPAISYGFATDCQMRATDLRPWSDADKQGTEARLFWNQQERGTFVVPVPGRHNLVNALAALCVSHVLGQDLLQAAARLRSFQPVRRRLDRIGAVNGATVISDYAHHPTEIRCLLEAARSLTQGRIVALFQPHRYTRTRALGPDFPAAFAGVDQVILAPVYAASEAPIPGGTATDLADHFEAAHCVPFTLAADLDVAWQQAVDFVQPGDLLLLVGAGDIDRLAQALAQQATPR